MYKSVSVFHVSVDYAHIRTFHTQTPDPPPAPNVTNVSFATAVSFTVEWSETPGSCETVDGFTFNITPNYLSCTRSSMTMVTCSYNRTQLGQAYTFSVAALNCDTQRGDEATRTVNLQGMFLAKKQTNNSTENGMNIWVISETAI